MSRRDKHREAEAVVQNIHDQLDALDPATRAAVVARLTSDEVKKVHDLRQRSAGVAPYGVFGGCPSALSW